MYCSWLSGDPERLRVSEAKQGQVSRDFLPSPPRLSHYRPEPATRLHRRDDSNPRPAGSDRPPLPARCLQTPALGLLGPSGRAAPRPRTDHHVLGYPRRAQQQVHPANLSPPSSTSSKYQSCPVLPFNLVPGGLSLHRPAQSDLRSPLATWGRTTRFLVGPSKNGPKDPSARQ